MKKLPCPFGVSWDEMKAYVSRWHRRFPRRVTLVDDDLGPRAALAELAEKMRIPHLSADERSDIYQARFNALNYMGFKWEEIDYLMPKEKMVSLTEREWQAQLPDLVAEKEKLQGDLSIFGYYGPNDYEDM
jgi:hypothetical protein